MQTEIAQAKREANYFARNVEISEKQKKKAAKQKPKQEGDNESAAHSMLISQYRQRRTDEEIKKGKNQPLQPEDRTEILKSLFGQ